MNTNHLFTFILAHNIPNDKYKMSKGDYLYKNLAKNGRHNLSGIKIAVLRKAMKPKMSQRALADKLQLSGLDVDKYVIQRIENGQRFVTDIELKAIAAVFNVTTDELVDE